MAQYGVIVYHCGIRTFSIRHQTSPGRRRPPYPPGPEDAERTGILISMSYASLVNFQIPGAISMRNYT
jgi:hypothetical protein